MNFAPEFVDVYELGIKSACDTVSVDCAHVDEQIFSESIVAPIYGEIKRADIIISEMMSQNAEGFYQVSMPAG